MEKETIVAGKSGKPHLLRDARAYLSGPMDFVASRVNEMKHGWRNRVGEFLRELGAVVFDPWAKPDCRGLHDYGREGADTTSIRSQWTFEPGAKGAKRRAAVSGKFWETQHIDLRMVDTADFVVAYCPTNIYSVGTPHEIVLCRLERKPVLLVSPPIEFPSLERLRKHLESDPAGLKLLEALQAEAGVKENPGGLPSLWYMPLVGGENFFDGFGFAAYRKQFRWKRNPLDDHEDRYEIRRPLLPFLEQLNREVPKKWDNRSNRFVENDDWLIWDLEPRQHGALVEGIVEPPPR
jgi:hypothetical protein